MDQRRWLDLWLDFRGIVVLPNLRNVVNRAVLGGPKLGNRWSSVGGWIFGLISEELWFFPIYEMQSIEEFWGVRNWGIDGAALVVGSLA
jgi:hypothetical protein